MTALRQGWAWTEPGTQLYKVLASECPAENPSNTSSAVGRCALAEASSVLILEYPDLASRVPTWLQEKRIILKEFSLYIQYGHSK